ncbi:hypothetical protein MAR_011221 [Mya arenaria]|uniref:Uncharacterized protein n=1 Tax=Mya arenaria TaxID=6604 RepID=A0ABY7FV66_MYAAR|nr:uncharacterized protein LOC128218609 [Mya arenaria]WAR25517.1 hypothetical protein MAR_011221 [Mya arenaria]
MPENGNGVDPVDQGTIVMLTLIFLMGATASFWFACNWFVKRRRKKGGEEERRTAAKTRLKQTFSRFSQVDEELTIQIDKSDEEILKEFSSNNRPSLISPARKGEKSTSRDSRQTDKKYLETDL